MTAPSPWVVRWSHLIAPAGSVLDVACGSGRHLKWLAARGHRVSGVDRDEAALAPLARELASELASEPAAGSSSEAELIVADVENGPWPFHRRVFDAVVVTNYLWRPRAADIVAAVAPGGVLIWETFAAGNETVGRPARADFLLQPGELLQVAGGLRVVAYEDGFLAAPERFVQRICAVREAPPGPGVPRPPPRFPLAPAAGQ